MKFLNKKSITSLAVAGLIIGVAGYVRTSSIVIALAVLATGITQERKVERIFAISIAIALLIVAIVLPHGR